MGNIPFVNEFEQIEIPAGLRLIEAVFRPEVLNSSLLLADSAILPPTNVDALQLNNNVLDKLLGREKVFTSIDEALTETPSDVLNFPAEFLYFLTPTGMLPHELKLKVGLTDYAMVPG